MQIMKNKKVWFFLMLGVMAVTTIYLWRSGVNETKAFANGRVVERQPKGDGLTTAPEQNAEEKLEIA